ncbi:glycosyltransferase family 4 protein [Glutamicibacter sp. PS]|uniref:glycosyltransferase family 4 protein n=1 Tax=Glutamicibacter sp. PS TaxID=3075634 RepID=UPI0028413FCF|nr:glycosyltransferase family 4 protein [Glutamicibacter sp. PS]MDR4533018.1 glycosyltransferase family 4 protein [Glutamicibacter sp. PS]
MRVLLLTHSFWPEHSPPQRRWAAFTKYFAEQGHKVSVVTPAPTSQAVYPENVEGAPPTNVVIHRYRSFTASHSMLGKLVKHFCDAVRSLPVGLRSSTPDVVIATVPALPTMVVGYALSKIWRVPFVVDLRDAWPDLLKDSKVLRISWLEPMISGLLGFLLRRSDLLVTTTNGLAEKMGVTRSNRTIVVRNGVDLSTPLVPLEECPRGNRLRVLYLGNLGRSQGLESVIEAVSGIQQYVELRIVGRGTEEDKLRKLAEDLHVDVDFREPVIGGGVLKNYAWADTCLVSLRSDWPSFEHTIPSKLYELMHLNRHVTGLVSGEAAEVIREAKAGHVVPQSVRAIQDYLVDLSHNREKLDVSRNGCDWVADHASLNELAAKFLDELVALVEDRRRDESL